MSEHLSELVRTICRYDPLTGEFVRVMRRSWLGNWFDCHSMPKSVSAYGYLQMSFEGRPYLVHRLIFLYMTGEFPPEDVDHINGDRLDNRWANLRLVSRQNNLRNQGLRIDNTSGVIGVHFDKNKNKWLAYIGVGEGKREALGYYETKDEAIDVRKAAEIRHGYHKNHGTRDGWGSWGK